MSELEKKIKFKNFRTSNEKSLWCQNSVSFEPKIKARANLKIKDEFRKKYEALEDNKVNDEWISIIKNIS